MSNDVERDREAEDATSTESSSGVDSAVSNESELSASADAHDDELEDEPPPTPFDHPLFLPVLLAGGALWFGYDGWFNPEIKAVAFNRWGAGLLLLGAAYYGFQAKREIDADKRSGNPDDR